MGSTQAVLSSPEKSQKGYGDLFDLQKGRLLTTEVQSPENMLPPVHIPTMSTKIFLLDKIV